MPFELYNTLTRKKELLQPGDPGRVSFYTCGPTVYDDAHIGNFRSFLAADVLRRWIESPLCELGNETAEQMVHRKQHGRVVTHVMNITDVGHMTDDAEGGESGEDRMAVAGRRIAEAKKSGKLPAGTSIDPGDPYQIAKFYEGRFREDARNLGLKVSIEAERDETLHPKATANVAGMITVIERLIAGGHAYVVGAPGSRVVYFRVKSFEPYGRLSGNTLQHLREGEGGRVNAANQAGKEHPADFLLWKEDASHIMKWESPWGTGYPGWHIECSVMSLRAMQVGAETAGAVAQAARVLALPDGNAILDIHSGGEDNIFPHHECEIAQSCCAFNADPAAGSFARMWFHPRFLMVEGAKMSKSKGNFYVPRELCAPVEQGGKGLSWQALRLELISGHYRSQADFYLENVKRAGPRIDRWREVVRLAMAADPNTSWKPGSSSPEAELIIAAGSQSGTSDVGGRLQDPRWTGECNQYQRAFQKAMNEDLNVWNAIGAFDLLLGGHSKVGSCVHEHEAKVQGTSVEKVNESLEAAKKKVVLPTAPWPHDAIAAVLNDPAKRGTIAEWLAYVHQLDHVVGVIFTPGNTRFENDLGVWASGLSPDPAVEALLRDRRDARAAKDFKKSDTIRDQLAGMGYAIKDMAGGKVEVRRA
ncbi:MAG: hypothetical protein WC718_07955 [Phycisphaerales bacterium]|jgi:cysteinyl-tRNA synthetase